MNSIIFEEAKLHRKTNEAKSREVRVPCTQRQILRGPSPLHTTKTQEQWDPFLCVNSVGIWLGFRTAMAQGLDDNMRKKIKMLGLPMSRPIFVLSDHLVHTAPALLYVLHLVRTRRRIPRVTAVYAFILSTWFSFRQGAKLDGSGIYVPHPWRRAWLAIVVGLASTPTLVDSLIQRRVKRALALVALMTLPYLSTKLDPTLKRKYDFAYALAHHARPIERSATATIPRSKTVCGATWCEPGDGLGDGPAAKGDARGAWGAAGGGAGGSSSSGR